MGNFFQELAKKLAERWVTLLVLPGVSLVLLAWLGSRLGHSHALDWTRASRDVKVLVAWLAAQPGATQAVLIVALLAGSTATGLAVEALAAPTRALWLGQWPRLVGPLLRARIKRRQRRWDRLVANRRAEEAKPRTPQRQVLVDAAAHRANRMSLARPGRPTWMGDRALSTQQVTLNRYGLDLSFGWARLWLVLPETTRTEITVAHTALAAAIATGTWAWPFALLAVLWWPAAAIAVAVGVTGWARARSAINDVAMLSEAAVDVHGRALAVVLGVATEQSSGPLTLDEGERVTALIRKGR